MKQTHTLRAAILLACAVGSVGTAAAADPTSKKKTQQQQIDALTQQLQAVQDQLKELATQNKALLDAQAQLQKEVDADHKAVMAAQSATPAAASVPVVSGLAPAGSGLSPATSGMSPTAGGPAGQRPAGPATAAALPASKGSGGADPIPVVGSGGTTLPGGIRLWGYGEVYYTRPSRVPARSQADLARAVFGIGYSIDSKTEFNSEFEVEHAVSSADDVGEFEVEQFYLDRQINDAITLRAGLFLMPFGLLNEYHEPTYFYGVQRNFVETLIIPSTWREGGLNLHGNTPIGLSWNAGVTTGIDLSKWNFAPEVPPYSTALNLEAADVAPLQASHQELALANAHNFSQYLALGYYGIPGVTVGAAAMTGKANPVAGTIGDQRVTLWEGHARWTPGDLDLSALYAHGAISNVGASNAMNPGTPNPIPSNFYGYYVQAAYDVWQHAEYRLAPFTRWERYDMASRYAGVVGSPIPSGLVPLSNTPGDYGYWPQNHDRVWTVGANFYTTPHVVFKADYQWFHTNTDFNRFDLGLGVNF